MSVHPANIAQSILVGKMSILVGKEITWETGDILSAISHSSVQRYKSKMAAIGASFIILSQFFCICFTLNNSLIRGPNVIIFMTDNLSIGDLSIYNNDSQQTPNIDRLMQEGATFSRWYTQSSRISSLASILTGLLPPRTGIIKSKFLSFKEIPSLASAGGLQHSEITLAEVLKSKGYATSFVGLWGLGVGRKGEYLPVSHGFDSWYGVPSAHKDHCTESYRTKSESQYTWGSVCSFFSPLLYIFPVVAFIVWYNGHAINMVTVFTIIIAFIFYSSILHDVIHYTIDLIQIRSCVVYKNSNIIEQPYSVENMTLRFTRSAVSFLETSSVSSKPFFLFVSFMNLNHPVFASRLFSNSTQSSYSDAVREVDWSIGRIMRMLKEHDIDNNTLILFTSATGHHIDELCDSFTQTQNEDKTAIFIKGKKKPVSRAPSERNASVTPPYVPADAILYLAGFMKVIVDNLGAWEHSSLLITTG